MPAMPTLLQDRCLLRHCIDVVTFSFTSRCYLLCLRLRGGLTLQRYQVPAVQSLKLSGNQAAWTSTQQKVDRENPQKAVIGGDICANRGS
jgi:hypothetical protein